MLRLVREAHFHVLTRAWGNSAVAFHVANLSMNLANVLLVFALMRLLSARSLVACLAGVLFAVQARGVETVAWVSGITGVLMTTFYLATLVLHLDSWRRPSAGWRVLPLVTFAAALLTHEAAVTLLPILAIMLWTVARDGGAVPGGLRRLTRGAWELSPYLLVLGAYPLVAYQVNRRNYVVTEGHFELGWHFLRNLLHYLVSLYVRIRP